VYRIGGGRVLVETVDFFTPVVDDPFVFGQIAAANALSDIYAMGARPVLALALAAFPTAVLPNEVLEQILRGGAEKVAEAGAVIGGGHTIDHDIPLYGLSVTGVAEEARITRNAGAQPGDALVLTKPLGIGVTISAGRADAIAREGVAAIFHRQLLPDSAMEEALAVMAALNRPAAEAMEGFTVHAATDITGYGLLGHAYEMMEASATTGEFSVGRIPLLSEARRLAERGIAPDGSRVNVRNLAPRSERGAGVTDDDFLLLCDAQTSGGLLVALPEGEAERYAAACRERGAKSAAIIGRVLAKGEKLLKIVA
jgi:selenide,water dikinase